MSQEQSSIENRLSAPTAIIIAGAMIALAVIFTSGGNSLYSGDNEAKPIAQDSKRELGEDFYIDIAVDLGIDQTAFVSCLQSGENIEIVKKDREEAISSGGRGTPYSIIVSADGEMVPVSGALPYNTIEPIILQAIEGELEGSQDFLKETIRPVDANDHIFGNPNAPVSLIEYSDLECPFCSRFHPTAQKIAEEYPEDVKWVYRHFPLDSIHAEATPAAIASECVSDLAGEEAFWTFIGRVFEGE